MAAAYPVTSGDSKPTPFYKLVSRECHPDNTIVRIGNVEIGRPGCPVVMAGPCAVESEELVQEIARRVAAAGAKILRGGAFKPRTSPYSFQGLGEEGLQILSRAAKANGLLVVTEVMDWETAPLVARYADILQIGSRNMANYSLLKKIGTLGKPVLLKRGRSASLDELLGAAEYLMLHGAKDVILCERGILGFDGHTRNTLDLSAVPVLRKLTHLPVIVDPSHGCGRRDIVVTMARASLVAGADGVIIECVVDPETARCDGAQSLLLDEFDAFMKDVDLLAPCLKAFSSRSVS